MDPDYTACAAVPSLFGKQVLIVSPRKIREWQLHPATEQSSLRLWTLFPCLLKSWEGNTRRYSHCMSSSKNHRTIFIHLHLGRASDYDPSIFPLVTDKTALKAGEVYLGCTLDEIIKMKDMVKERPNYRKEYKDMKRQYDQYVFFAAGSAVSKGFIAGRLAATMKKIEKGEKTSNPFKALARYRRNRLFIDAMCDFRLQVKVACINPAKYSLLIGIAEYFGGDETTYPAINESAFSGIRRRSTSRTCVSKLFIQYTLITHTGGDISTEQKRVSGIAIKCDRDLDDNLRAIIEEAASILTQPDPFDDSSQVDNDSAPRRSPTAWMSDSDVNFGLHRNSYWLCWYIYSIV